MAFDTTSTWNPGGLATTANQALTNAQQGYTNLIQNMPTYQNSLNAQADETGRSSYNASKQNIDTNANSRGLLYSGLKQGAEASAAGSAAAKSADQKVNNNLYLNNLATGALNNTVQTGLGNYQNQLTNANNQYGSQMGSYNQNLGQTGNLISGLGSIAGIAMLSDKNKKESIKEDSSSKGFLDKIEPKTFNYKDDPEKEKHHGILAQDLEKSPMGKTLVVDTPKGKGVDIARSVAALLSVQGALHKRMKKVEAKSGDAE